MKTDARVGVQSDHEYFTNPYSIDNSRMQEVTPQDGLGYRHNSGQDEANNPCIIVRAYEGHYAFNNRPAVPHTPRLAQAYRQGMLDANYGQSISFPSSYKCCFRLEVPVWYADDGHSPPEVAQEATGIATLAKPVSPVAEPEPKTFEAVQMGAEVAPANEDEEVEADDETYLVPAGYGCFSFQRGLLHRAARTYEVRSVGNKYEVIGLATGRASCHDLPEKLEHTLIEQEVHYD